MSDSNAQKKEDRSARFPNKEGGGKTSRPRRTNKNKGKARQGRPKNRGRANGRNREEKPTKPPADPEGNPSTMPEHQGSGGDAHPPKNAQNTNGKNGGKSSRSKQWAEGRSGRKKRTDRNNGGGGENPAPAGAVKPTEPVETGGGGRQKNEAGILPEEEQPPAAAGTTPTVPQPPFAQNPYGVAGFAGVPAGGYPFHPQLAYPQQNSLPYIPAPVSPAGAAGTPATPFSFSPALVQQQLNAAHNGAVYNPAYYNPMGYSPWAMPRRTNTKPIRSDVEFIALYLTTESVESLKSFLESKKMTPLAATEPGGKDAPHCLILFRPSKEELTQYTPGTEANVTITGWINHEAELVTLLIDHPTIRSENPVPHITTRQARGRPPSWTNTLIKTTPVNTVTPGADGDELKLKTRLGMYHRYSQSGPVFGEK